MIYKMGYDKVGGEKWTKSKICRGKLVTTICVCLYTEALVNFMIEFSLSKYCSYFEYCIVWWV